MRVARSALVKSTSVSHMECGDRGEWGEEDGAREVVAVCRRCVMWQCVVCCVLRRNVQCTMLCSSVIRQRRTIIE